LHTDPFEIPNIVGKKLIIISDTEYYRGNISQLKAIVGGDLVKRRIKNVQGSFDVVANGMVLIIGNVPIGVRDNSNALLRTMKTFKATNVSESKIPLIFFKRGEFKGELIDELLGIFNWIVSMKDEEVKAYLTNTKYMVPSFSQQFQEAQELVDPITQWIREELKPSDQNSYIGYTSQENSKLSKVKYARRRPLYPAYFYWMKRQGSHPIGQKMFSTHLMSALQDLGYSPSKVRRVYGHFIEGVEVKPEVYN
jgi:phage/plasmid-associated DNA primase